MREVTDMSGMTPSDWVAASASDAAENARRAHQRVNELEGELERLRLRILEDEVVLGLRTLQPPSAATLGRRVCRYCKDGRGTVEPEFWDGVAQVVYTQRMPCPRCAGSGYEPVVHVFQEHVASYPLCFACGKPKNAHVTYDHANPRGE